MMRFCYNTARGNSDKYTTRTACFYPANGAGIA
jgi:hypothetical protein